MLQNSSEFQKSECPDIWVRLQRHKCPKSWSNIEDPVVPLDRNVFGHPFAGLLWERQFKEVLMELGWEKVQNLDCLLVHRKQRLFLSVYVDNNKMAGEKAEYESYVEEIDEKR